MSPLEKFWKQEFTYELEKMHYEERPYPITSVPFEDVPLIGPFLAGTIGRLIKPPRLMHTEEWMGEGGLLRQPPRFGQRVATEIGETAGPPPETPFNVTGMVGEQAYRLTEMIGLPGFVMTSIKEALTGTPDLFDQIAQLESARRISGMERQYWDLEVGGGLGTTEFVRRLYPHRRRQIPLYNPIRNLMPGWLPGPGAKAPDFLHGDPYTKVMEGELRLPGRGYAARYPELEDIAPGEYPLVHRFKILADVAPYSDEFKEHLAMARAARNRGDWTEEEERIYTMTMDQLKEKKQRKVFQEYEYLSPMGEVFGGEKVYWEGEDESGLLAKMNVIKASREGGEKSLFSKLFGGYWELLSHNAETTLDQLTPISPGAKLVHMRTAIENYERTQLFGTENAFWSHPIRDFFRPSMYLGLHAFGYDEIPKHIQERRQMEEYFDVLKYVKNTRLANIARLDKDKAAVREFEQRKDQTLFGVNPFTRNFSSIFRALPRRERDYFNAFAAAETESERRRVLEIVPENERSLYLARWRLAFSDELRRAKKGEILTDQEEAAADEIIRETYAEAKTEGLPTSKELFGEYLETKLPNENYPDWYRRVKLLAGVPLPGPDWVGWHPSVDLDDVKLKVVQSLGEDMHDYDLWPQRAQVLMNKQYINEEAIAPILEPEELSSEEIRDRIDDILVGERLRASVFSSSTFVGEGTRVNIDHVADEPPINRRRLWQ
jgi:hypothetical protein